MRVSKVMVRLTRVPPSRVSVAARISMEEASGILSDDGIAHDTTSTAWSSHSMKILPTLKIDLCILASISSRISGLVVISVKVELRVAAMVAKLIGLTTRAKTTVATAASSVTSTASAPLTTIQRRRMAILTTITMQASTVIASRQLPTINSSSHALTRASVRGWPS